MFSFSSSLLTCMYVYKHNYHPHTLGVGPPPWNHLWNDSRVVWYAHPLKSFFQHRLPIPWDHFSNNYPSPWNHFINTSGTSESFLKNNFVCHVLLSQKIVFKDLKIMSKNLKWFQGGWYFKVVISKDPSKSFHPNCWNDFGVGVGLLKLCWIKTS